MAILVVAIVVGAFLIWWPVGRARLGRVWRPRGRDRRLDGQFRDWIGQAELERRAVVYKSLPSDAAQFAAWVRGLGDDDLRAFVREVSDFCDRRGVKLAWLTDSSITGDLKLRLEEAVGLYCLSSWKSRELQPFVTYLAWRADPSNEKHQPFARGLFSRMVTAGLVTPSPDQWSAPERERQAFAATAMDAVAAQDPRTFAAFLKETAAGEPSAQHLA